MKVVFLSVLLLAGVLPIERAHTEGICTSSSKLLCLSSGAEDMVRVPKSDWLIASAPLRAIDTKRRAVVPLASSADRFDKAKYRDCPGPLAALDTPGEQLHTHGLNIRAGAGGEHTLYVVYHGARESVEIFHVGIKAAKPYLVWIGCAVAPEGVRGNGIAVLPGDGFALTSFSRVSTSELMGPKGVLERAKYSAGKVTGEVWEWGSGTGWKILPGTEGSGLNGIEASADGKWIYFNEWAASKVVKVSRGARKITRQEALLSFHPDNIRWQSDGSLIAAGQNATTDEVFECAITKECSSLSASVVRIDPDKMTSRLLVDRLPATPVFGMGTGALMVGDDLWLSALVGQAIIIRPTGHQ